MAVSASEVYAKWRYRLIPDHVLGEILSKNWIDNAIPVAILHRRRRCSSPQSCPTF